MAKRSRLKTAVVGVLVAATACVVVAWIPWCRAVSAAPPALQLVAASIEPLRAGAAAVELDVHLPTAVAGYGPPRATANRMPRPLLARALVLQSGELTWGLVSVDLLLIPADVADEVRRASGLSDVWAMATHTHSSFGGYDARPLAQFAGTGRFDAAAREAVVKASLAALEKARGAVRPCTVGVGHGVSMDLSAPRSGTAADGRLTRLSFASDTGPIAELVVGSAHPTLVSRGSDWLDPDWPGAVSAAREAAGVGVALLVQGAGGNASAAIRDGESLQSYGDRFAASVGAVTTVPSAAPGLTLVRVGVRLPATDASRLVPALARGPANNLVCTQGDTTATVALARLAGVTLLAVPVEPSFAEGRALEATAGAARVVSLAGGYLGYVEPPDVVARGEGESRRQYYAADLSAVLQAGARAAVEALALTTVAAPPK